MLIIAFSLCFPTHQKEQKHSTDSNNYAYRQPILTGSGIQTVTSCRIGD